MFITNTNRPVTIDEIHDVTDVCMNALHSTYGPEGEVDSKAVVAAMTGMALGILKDIGVEDPKATLKELINNIDLDEIVGFNPGLM